MWFMEEPSQFSMGQTAQSLTCSIMEKPRTGLDGCLRMLQACFRKRMSDFRASTTRDPNEIIETEPEEAGGTTPESIRHSSISSDLFRDDFSTKC